MKEMFKTIEVLGHQHVIKEMSRQPLSDTKLQANYRNTGMCLCGILRKKQSLENFIANYIQRKKYLNTKKA